MSCSESVNSEPYVDHIPPGRYHQHFSSLLFSGEWLATGLEVALLTSLTSVAVTHPYLVNVPGSMPLLELALAMWFFSALRRFYNSYLEAVFCCFPQFRTQPVKEHELKNRKDLVGREPGQLQKIAEHDRLTLVSQFLLDVAIYFLVPGYYPAALSSYPPMYMRIGSMIANHYVMSFGMYWMHRALHVNAWLWRNIHSLHHWAKHPLSRTTYQDHWFDNFGNAIVGHFFAQVLIPLDHDFFFISRIIRVCESLEKHSGVSCWFNMAHSLQRYFPFAQMPHHHDWHHEGHKGCNYTFSSLGGLWDCLFGTRKTGRHPLAAETPRDRDMAAADQKTGGRKALWMDNPWVCFTPVIILTLMVLVKIYL